MAKKHGTREDVHDEPWEARRNPGGYDGPGLLHPAYKARAPFRPTHVIQLNLHGGRTRRIPVMLVDGAAYTRDEWTSSTSADWERSRSGSWTFQGEAVPAGVESVTVLPVEPRRNPEPVDTDPEAELRAENCEFLAERVELPAAARMLREAAALWRATPRMRRDNREEATRAWDEAEATQKRALDMDAEAYMARPNPARRNPRRRY